MIGLLTERRAAPRQDFLGTLLDSGDLSDDEIIANGMLLLLAGHVAVRNLIGNAVYLLLTHPEQFARLQSNPALLASAIEETLRYEPPVAMIPRVALQDIEVEGAHVRRGDLIRLVIALANRDEAHFPDAGRFDIERKHGRVLTFGNGPHGCLGAHLARGNTDRACGALRPKPAAALGQILPDCVVPQRRQPRPDQFAPLPLAPRGAYQLRLSRDFTA